MCLIEEILILITWVNMSYFVSSIRIFTSRRQVETQTMSKLTPYFTMTKFNKLFITYLIRSTKCCTTLPYTGAQYSMKYKV